MIYTVIRVDKKIEVHNTTERALRQTLGCPFEVLEIHKSEAIANERAQVLRTTTYKKIKKTTKGLKKLSRLGKKKMSERMKGENNPRYGKKHSPEALKRISEAKLGNRHAAGKRPTEAALKKYKQKRKKWTAVQKGSMWFYHPDTGEQKRSMTVIEGWCRGRSPDQMENIIYLTFGQKTKYRNRSTQE